MRFENNQTLTRLIIKVALIPFLFFFWITGLTYLFKFTLTDFLISILLMIIAYKITEILFE